MGHQLDGMADLVSSVKTVFQSSEWICRPEVSEIHTYARAK